MQDTLGGNITMANIILWVVRRLSQSNVNKNARNITADESPRLLLRSTFNK